MALIFRRWVGALALATGTILSGVPAAAAYPDRPIQIVSPYLPGGAADSQARMLAKKLEEQLGVSVVVDNKPGAGTSIGAQAVANARPDGYTLLLSASSTFTTNPALMPRLAYDPVKSFVPIGMIGTVALTLVVNPNVPAKTVAELVQLAKAQPDKYSFGSFGNGTAAHFAGEMFNAATGTRITHVPYRGSAQSMTDLIGGQIPAAFDTVVAASPHVKAGKIRALAVVGDKRSAQLPNVPTMAEAGYPDVDIVSWIALVAPHGLPADVHARLEKALAAVMASPDTQERLRSAGFEVDYRLLPDWAKLVGDEIARMRRIAQRSKITLD